MDLNADCCVGVSWLLLSISETAIFAKSIRDFYLGAHAEIV